MQNYLGFKWRHLKQFGSLNVKSAQKAERVENDRM